MRFAVVALLALGCTQSVAPSLTLSPEPSTQPPTHSAEPSVGAATSTPEASPTPTHLVGCPGALLEGVLLEDEGGFVVDGDGIPKGSATPVKWPSEYRVRDDDGLLVLEDQAGTVIAREGDHVRLGGGFMSNDQTFTVCGYVEVVTRTPEPASQGAIVRAVGVWLAGNKRDEMTPTMYVLSDLNDLGAWYEADQVPELHGAIRIWSNELTEASQSALGETLGEIAAFELVHDWQSLEDEDAFGQFGCHPWIGGRAMLRLQRPFARGDQYFVEANIDQGCKGAMSLLRIESTGSHFEVTEVIRDGHWIV